jgi:hypothetical protein
VLGNDLDDAEAGARARSGPPPGRTGAISALADRVSTLTSSASGADRTIRVTVASSGIVTGLELDDRVQRMPGAELAEEILRVMRRAQAGLADRVTEAVRETVGEDTETGRAVLASYGRRFPAEPDAAPTSPVMPSPPPFPSFPSVPQQGAGGARARQGH